MKLCSAIIKLSPFLLSASFALADSGQTIRGARQTAATNNDGLSEQDAERLRAAETLLGGQARTANAVGENNCSNFHSGVGCCQSECEAAVCALDSFCCEVNWDSICSDAACGIGGVCSDFSGACSDGCVGGDAPLPTPPSTDNDFCEGALPLESFQTGSTELATLDNVGTCGPNNDNTAPGVWYTVSGISGPITVDTCSSSSDFDTKISVFQGSCGVLTCVDGNDDDFNCSLDGLHSSVTWTASASEQYFVLVHGFAAGTGEFGLNAALPSGPNPPSTDNDLCEGALPLESFQTGSTALATLENVGFCGTTNSAAGVWYTVTGISGQITVDTCSSSSDFDTAISVFQGSCGVLTCVDGNDDFSCSLSGLHSSVTWTATASEQYFVLVHGFGSNTGEFGLNALLPSGPPVPPLETLLPSGPPVPPLETPCVETETPFNAGFGDCSTYAEGLTNNGFCSSDVDSNGVVAQDACAECGVCVGDTTPTPPTTDNDNDLCENALPLDSFQTGSTELATLDNVGTCGPNNDNTAPGVWYTVSGISGPITVDTCSSSSDFDTKISVFQGSCGVLTCVDGNDDDFNCSLDGLHSSVTWTASASEQYFVLVHGFSSETGEFGLNAVFGAGPPVPPADNDLNDLCEDALPLESFQTGSTALATIDSNAGTCGFTSVSSPGVWYTVSGVSGQITVDTCSSSSNFDTKISVFQGSCGALTCVDGNDDDFGCSISGVHSSVTWTATESEQYFVLVHGFGGAVGEFGLNAIIAA